MRATDSVARHSIWMLALALGACGSPSETPVSAPAPVLPTPSPSAAAVPAPPPSGAPAIGDPFENLLDDAIPDAPLDIGYDPHRGEDSPPYAMRVARARFGTIDVAPPRPLSRATVTRIVQRHLSEIRFCYEITLNGTPELAGDLELTWTIEPSGATSNVTVASSSLHTTTSPDGGEPARAVETCARQAVLRWTFPATEHDAGVCVTCPVTLDSAPGA